MLSRASDLSPAACLTTRFDGLNSSISCRTACRSSVAETTGNSSMRTQPKTKKGRTRAKRWQFCTRTDSWRHIQRAGSANISQRRLSSNSILSANSLTQNGDDEQARSGVYDAVSVAKYRLRVNVIVRVGTFVPQEAGRSVAMHRPKIMTVRYSRPGFGFPSTPRCPDRVWHLCIRRPGK